MKMFRLQEYFQFSPSVDVLFCETHKPNADGFERSAIVTEVESRELRGRNVTRTERIIL